MVIAMLITTLLTPGYLSNEFADLRDVRCGLEAVSGELLLRLLLLLSSRRREGLGGVGFRV